MTVIDTRPNIAGEWDSDLFVDLEHFTRKGANRLARRLFDGLVALLKKIPLYDSCQRRHRDQNDPRTNPDTPDSTPSEDLIQIWTPIIASALCEFGQAVNPWPPGPEPSWHRINPDCGKRK